MADMTILHEDAVRAVVVDEAAKHFATKTTAAAITKPAAAGAAYDQVEQQAIVDAVNHIIDALKAANITA